MNKYVRFDNYSNLMSGLGIGGLDRTANTFWNPSRGSTGWRPHNMSGYWLGWTNHYELADMYMRKGLASKIIDRPADDAFQRGLQIEGDADGIMMDEYDRLSVFTVMANAIRWSRLFGGSAILLIAKDGGTFADPLNLNSLETIEEIRVLDITRIQPTDRYYLDPMQSNYGQMEYYTISQPGSTTFDVHETRLITIGGEPMPQCYNLRNRLSWVGRSSLEGCIDSLSKYEQALEWSLRLIERKQQGIYNMVGLAEMLANGDDNLAVKRINMVDQVRSNLNSVMIDNEDTYNVLNLGLDGLDTMINEYQIAISADCNIPITILFGKSTTGLNATGSGDLESYYGMVKHIQEVQISPALEKLTAILWVQKSLTGQIPDDWEIVFNPLWVPTDMEVAQADNQQSQADNTEATMLLALMTNGILDPEEVRKVIVNDMLDEYDFPDTLPSSGGDINYANMVDLQNLVNGTAPGSNATGNTNTSSTATK